MSEHEILGEDDEIFGYPLSGDELRQMISASPEERTAYFVDKCIESGQIWTVGADEELVVLATDDEEPFVVGFPHPEFGQDWSSTTDLDEVDLVSIRTEDWTREILPGLQEAGIQVLIFPTSEENGVLRSANDVAEMLSKSQQ